MFMRRVLMAALASATLALTATPAFAANPQPLTLVDDCHANFVTIGTGSSAQGAIACVGYYDNNQLSGDIGDAPTANAQTAIGYLLAGSANDSTSDYHPAYTLDVSTIIDKIEKLNDPTASFSLMNDTTMSGLTVLGVHWGNNGDSTGRSVTAFYLFNLTGSSDIINLGNGGKGASNAQLYSTGTPAVPEPATWAMMLLGFGGIGMTMRRRRRNTALMQVA